MYSEFFTGKCPQCKEILQIPTSLKEFSCMYCGARLHAADLQTEEGSAVLCAAYYHAHVLEAITAYTGYERKLTRTEFEPAFAAYTKGNEEIFRQLDRAVSAGILTTEEAARDFLDQLEAHWQTLRRTTALIDTHKFIIAIFLVPMVRKMELPCGEAYCQDLQAIWCQRRPKNPFYLGNYQDISGGFRKKYLGLCFITTAVCRDSGKPDDCAELSAFRTFRDGYLRSCPDGPALISEYYDVAPGIVTRIDLSSHPSEVYEALQRDYLEPCYADLRAGRLAQCKERYVQMVRELEQKYLN